MAKFDKIYKEIVETIDKKGIWSLTKGLAIFHT